MTSKPKKVSKPVKPIKAWVRIGENGEIIDSTLERNTLVVHSKRPKKSWSAVKVIPVRIVPLK